MKTAAAPMPRAQRYKVERRAGAVVAASSFSLALLELWGPLAAALLRAALLAWGSTADAVTCTAERATRVIDCMINSRRHNRYCRLPRTPDRCRRRSQSDVLRYCKLDIDASATQRPASNKQKTQRRVLKTDATLAHGCARPKKSPLSHGSQLPQNHCQGGADGRSRQHWPLQNPKK